MLRYIKRFRVLSLSVLVILVGSYTYVSKWCLLNVSNMGKGESNEAREVIRHYSLC